MNYLYIVGLVIVVFLLLNNKALKLQTNDYNGHKIVNIPDLPSNYQDYIHENSFVKPQHKLLRLLNNISSSDKIVLLKIVDKDSFTQGTIPLK